VVVLIHQKDLFLIPFIPGVNYGGHYVLFSYPETVEYHSPKKDSESNKA
jgi:hypothetical protein